MGFGILLLLLGIAALVYNRAAPRRNLGSIGLAGVVLGLFIAVAASAFVIVPAGSVGVVFNALSGVKGGALGPGTHFIVPGIESVVLYDTRLKELTLSRRGEEGADRDESIKARSKEGLEIEADVTIQYRIPNDERIASFHKEIGPRFDQTVVRPQIRSKVRDGVGQFNAADLISTQRSALESQVTEALRESFASQNIELVGVLLRELRIPESVAKVIEEKQTAEQQVAIERNRLQQANIAAQRKVVEAEGEAKATIAKAQGESQALSLRGKALKENPEIIQLTVAEKLAPSIQTVMLPSDGNFLLDINSLTGRATTKAATKQ
ncbi:MAG TPA: prohibitin family protein [Deinococcales bacterium]|nr:prohibitin family protein [Deinococcales bacterium]